MFAQKSKSGDKRRAATLTYNAAFEESLEKIKTHFNLASNADVIQTAVALLDLEVDNEIKGNQLVIVNSKGKIVNTVSFGDGHERPLLEIDVGHEKVNKTSSKQKKNLNNRFQL